MKTIINILIIFVYLQINCKSNTLQEINKFDSLNDTLNCVKLKLVEIQYSKINELLDAVIYRIDTSVIQRDSVPHFFILHFFMPKNSQKIKYLTQCIVDYSNIVDFRKSICFYYRDNLFIIDSEDYLLIDKLFNETGKLECIHIPEKFYNLLKETKGPFIKYDLMDIKYVSWFIEENESIYEISNSKTWYDL